MRGAAPQQPRRRQAHRLVSAYLSVSVALSCGVGIPPRGRGVAAWWFVPPAAPAGRAQWWPLGRTPGWCWPAAGARHPAGVKLLLGLPTRRTLPQRVTHALPWLVMLNLFTRCGTREGCYKYGWVARQRDQWVRLPRAAQRQRYSNRCEGY